MSNILITGNLRWLFCLLMLLGKPASALPETSTKPLYVAVVDAGSSGSRLYLYCVTRSANTSEIEDMLQFESDAPALSSFKGNEAELGEKGLKPLFQQLIDFLLKNKIPKSDVEVDILATAGMRLLESTEQRAIFDRARNYIKDLSLTPDYLETIPGEMEGVYSWVDVNYLLGNFRVRQPTVGIIEIGGASAQIAFETSEMVINNEAIDIQGKTYHILAQSFLGLGRNEARKRMIEIPGGVSGTVKNPCYPQGLTVDDQKAKTKDLTGDFVYSACVRNYETVLSKFGFRSLRNLIESGQKSFAAVGTGNPVGTFWGLLEAWKVASTDPFEILEQEVANCVRPWTEIAAKYGNAAFNKTQCADSVLLTTFLYGEGGLGLRRGSVTSYKTIRSRSPTWTRGVVVLKYLK